jgi:hypothetical protein
VFGGWTMSAFVCECCRLEALRAARAALELLGAGDASETTSEVASEELGRAIEVLRKPSALRVFPDEGARS